jgi:hypothetical protein
VIHLKVLSDPTIGTSEIESRKNENESSNVLFQITSSLRNVLSSNKSKESLFFKHR